MAECEFTRLDWLIWEKLELEQKIRDTHFWSPHRKDYDAVPYHQLQAKHKIIIEEIKMKFPLYFRDNGSRWLK